MNASDAWGTTPLRLAVPHAATARTLLEAHALPLPDRRGTTPLHVAAQGSEYATTKLLVAAGAHTDARTRHGGTALGLAEQRGHGAVATLLSQPLSQPGPWSIVDVGRAGRTPDLMQSYQGL